MILPSLGEAHLRHTFASLLIAAGKNPLPYAESDCSPPGAGSYPVLVIAGLNEVSRS